MARPARCAGRGAGAGDRAALQFAGNAGAGDRGPRRRDRRGRGFSRSDHPQIDARSLHRDADGNRGQAHRGRGHARRAGRDLRRLRRRRRDLGGAADLASAPLRARSADPYSRPHFRRLRAQYRSRADAGGQGRDPAGDGRLRHHQHRAAGGGAKARHVRRRHRSPPDRRRTARGRCAGESEPARRSLRPRLSRRRRPRAGDAGRRQPRIARPGDSGPANGRSRICSACCITSRSAPWPTSRR